MRTSAAHDGKTSAHGRACADSIRLLLRSCGSENSRTIERMAVLFHENGTEVTEVPSLCSEAIISIRTPFTSPYFRLCGKFYKSWLIRDL